MADDFSSKEPSSLNMALLTRFLVFIIIAGFFFVIFFWIVFVRNVDAEVRLESSVEIYGDGELVAEELQVGEYDVKASYYEIYFDGIDLIRLVEGSSFYINEIVEEDGFYTISLTLEGGAMWISNMGGVLDLMLETDNFMFQNVDGYYYVEKQADNVFAYAYKHPLRVHFLDEQDNSLNSYLLPEGYYGVYEESSVTSVVSDLRYAKLTKEYPFYSLADEQYLEFWDDFVVIDDSRYVEILSEFKTLVRRNYDVYYEGGGFLAKIGDAMRFLREYLTFIDAKKDQWIEQDTLRSLNSALYLSVKGEEEEAVDILLAMEEGTVDSDYYKEYLNYLNVVLNNSLYSDELYAVKDYLRSLLWGSTEEGEIVILRERLNEMYDLVNEGKVTDAKEAFSDYERGWFSFLAMSVSELSPYRKDVSEERELLSVFLQQESGFYSAKYFDLLENFEQAVVKVAVSGADLDEERQAFVSDKIKVLNNIEDLLRVNGIEVEDATEVMLLLLDSAEVLMDEIASEAAILSYFEEQLAEAMLVLQFINSAEYTGLSGTFDERFEAYLEKQADVEELQEYLQAIHLGVDEGSELTLTEAKDIVYGALDSIGVSYDAVTSLGDSAYRLFEIEGASVNEVSFEARYDREGELIYDLSVGDVEFATGVNLDDLSEVVLGLFEESDTTTETTDSGPQVAPDEDNGRDLSYSEELAISMLIDYLADYDVEILEEHVISWDLDQNIFYVQGEGILAEDVEVEFFVNASEDQVTDIVVAGEDVSGIYGTSELKAILDSYLE